MEVASSGWRGHFPDVEVVVEVTAYSDHTPLILCLHGHEVRGRGQKKFLYEEWWILKERYTNTIKKAWGNGVESGSGWVGIGAKIAWCQKELWRWQRRGNDSLHECIASPQN